MRRTAEGTSDAVVVGGGFAGLAAATALAERGVRITLLEARPHLGGRARSWVDPGSGGVVDNGQHLFMGCYTETLAFLRRLGTFDRLEFQPRLELLYLEPGDVARTFRLPRIPAPLDLLWGLLRFPGLDARSRLGLLRVGRAIRGFGRGDRAGRQVALDATTVDEWLTRLGQSAEANRRLWHPLAIAALNETPDVAAASLFARVLGEAFLQGTDGSRLALPRVGLSDLYAHPAAHYLRGRGATVRLSTPVRRLLFEGGRCAGVLLADGRRLAAAAVVAAVPPADLLEIVPPEIAADPFLAPASRIGVAPIVSVYLWYGAPVTDLPFAGLIGSGTWQWMFNRGAMAGESSGTHAVTLVRSSAHGLVDRPAEVLVRSAIEDLRAVCPAARRSAPRRSLVIKERKATLSPRRGGMALRPPSRTPYRGLHLAGDWTATGLPATIEGAVRSGHACAVQALDELGP